MIPGWGIKISHAPGQKEKKKKETEGMKMVNVKYYRDGDDWERDH